MSSEGHQSQNPRGKLEPTPVETQTVPDTSRRSSAPILRDTSRSAISTKQDTMSSGLKISSLNALGLSTSAESSGTLYPTRNHVSQHDSPSSPISWTSSEEVGTSRHQAQAKRLERAAFSAEVMLPDAIPFPTGPSQFDFSRNPTAFASLDLRTTIDNVASQAIREAALQSLMIKFPVLRTRSPIHPLLRCASEILHVDDRMGNVLTTLSMAELVELQELHLAVMKELRPWFRGCQMPKPWRGNAPSCATWTQREGGLYLSAWPFLAIAFESRAQDPAVEAYQAIICRVFQGTVSWSDLLLILEDRERYRQMDYEVKKAWLRTLFVIATVRPSPSQVTGGCLSKQLRNRNRRTQLLSDSSHQSPLAGSSSTSRHQPSNKASRKESCARPVDRVTKSIDSRKRNGHASQCGFGGDASHAGSVKSGRTGFTNGKNGKASKRPAFAEDGKSSTGVTDERASSGIKRFYIPVGGEDSSEVESEWSLSPFLGATTTPTDATPNSEDQSVPTSPPTSYVADKESAGNEADVSCLEPKTGIGAEAPSDVTGSGQGTAVRPSRSSLTERLASLPPDQRPAPFYPGSQLQQQHRHSADQNVRNIEGSFGPTRMRPFLRTESLPDRSDAQTVSHGVQPDLTRRQSPFAPRHFLPEHGSSNPPEPTYRPVDRTSSPEATADEDSRPVEVSQGLAMVQVTQANIDSVLQSTQARKQPLPARMDLPPQSGYPHHPVPLYRAVGDTTSSDFKAENESRPVFASHSLASLHTPQARHPNVVPSSSSAAREQDCSSRSARPDDREDPHGIVASWQPPSKEVPLTNDRARRSSVNRTNRWSDGLP